MFEFQERCSQLKFSVVQKVSTPSIAGAAVARGGLAGRATGRLPGGPSQNHYNFSWKLVLFGRGPLLLP